VQIKMLESKLKGHRTAKADLERGVKSVDSYERAIGTAENRVKKSLNDYNTQLADNTRLREQIDGLKKEREVFNELQRKLGRELSDQKAAMANVIMQSNAAFETRDEAQAKMTALQEKHEKEAVAADREIKELNRVLEHERKLRDFMGQKARSRAKASHPPFLTTSVSFQPFLSHTVSVFLSLSRPAAHTWSSPFSPSSSFQRPGA
jgi:chromosome segregation ATPase